MVGKLIDPLIQGILAQLDTWLDGTFAAEGIAALIGPEEVEVSPQEEPLGRRVMRLLAGDTNAQPYSRQRRSSSSGCS